MISTVPWDDVGSFVRFSVTYIAKEKNDEIRIMDEIKKRLSTVTFEF